ncbi:hypothetical protein [Roseovarius sp.]
MEAGKTLAVSSGRDCDVEVDQAVGDALAKLDAEDMKEGYRALDIWS